ncbi:MAG: PIN domain-containing protein [Anaerolineae bacterium]
MGWVDAIEGQLIAIDTAPLIYFIEESPVYLPVVLPFFKALDQQIIQVVTSTVTLIEVLVQPLRQNNHNLVKQYREVLTNVAGLTTYPLTVEIAAIAADLRAKYTLRTPDAVQMATAIYAGAQYLLTNDARLPDLTNLRRVLLDDCIH